MNTESLLFSEPVILEQEKLNTEPKPEIKTEIKIPEFNANEIKNVQPLPPSPEPEKKKGRGRPFGSTKKPSEGGNTGNNNLPKQPQSGDKKEELNKILSGYNSTAQQTTSTPSPGQLPPNDVKPQISGYLFLIVCDAILPGLILKVIGFASSAAARIPVGRIKLTAEEKRELEPVADEAAKMIFGQMNPLAAFFMSLGFMYAGKIMSHVE